MQKHKHHINHNHTRINENCPRHHSQHAQHIHDDDNFALPKYVNVYNYDKTLEIYDRIMKNPKKIDVNLHELFEKLGKALFCAIFKNEKEVKYLKKLEEILKFTITIDKSCEDWDMFHENYIDNLPISPWTGIKHCQEYCENHNLSTNSDVPTVAINDNNAINLENINGVEIKFNHNICIFPLLHRILRLWLTSKGHYLLLRLINIYKKSEFLDFFIGALLSRAEMFDIKHEYYEEMLRNNRKIIRLYDHAQTKNDKTSMNIDLIKRLEDENNKIIARFNDTGILTDSDSLPNDPDFIADERLHNIILKSIICDEEHVETTINMFDFLINTTGNFSKKWCCRVIHMYLCHFTNTENIGTFVKIIESWISDDKDEDKISLVYNLVRTYLANYSYITQKIDTSTDECCVTEVSTVKFSGWKINLWREKLEEKHKFLVDNDKVSKAQKIINEIVFESDDFLVWS
jgi:hypothetical protein